MNSRQKELLNRVIVLYERTNEPVGSKAICDEMGLSSATIRNEMSELSRLGFLEQPHTSAGRIPSQRAYRLYVDELMTPVELSQKEKDHIYHSVFSAGNPEIMLMRACEAMSDITEQMALALTPSDAQSFVSKTELVPIGIRSYLLVLMTDSGMVKSCHLRMDEVLSPSETAAFCAACKMVFENIPLMNIDKGTIQGLFSAGGVDLKFASVSGTLLSLIESTCNSELKVSGEINLFSRCEIPIEKAKKILSMLRSRHILPELMAFSDKSTEIIIGSDFKNDALSTASLVLSDYSFLDRPGGRLGILGAAKMPYSHILPVVQYTAKTVGDALTNLFETDGRNIYVQIR